MAVIRTVFLCSCLVGIVFTSSSCYKEPLHPIYQQYFPLDSTSREYFAFSKAGSQWVYEIQNWNETDTTKETSLNSSYNTGDSLSAQGILLNYETDVLNFTSTLAGNFTVNTTRLANARANHYLFSLTYSNYYLYSDISAMESNNVVFGATKLDSMQVLNRVFKNVIHLVNYSHPYIVDVYFVKNIGIIQKSVYGKVYQLKSWNIVN